MGVRIVLGKQRELFRWPQSMSSVPCILFQSGKPVFNGFGHAAYFVTIVHVSVCSQYTSMCKHKLNRIRSIS